MDWMKAVTEGAEKHTMRMKGGMSPADVQTRLKSLAPEDRPFVSQLLSEHYMAKGYGPNDAAMLADQDCSKMYGGG